MAGGWTRDGAVQDQIEDSVLDALFDIRARMPIGVGQPHCEVCGEDIPERRRRAVPGVKTCIHCQAARDNGAR